jgi:hypothetical protein
VGLGAIVDGIGLLSGCEDSMMLNVVVLVMSLAGSVPNLILEAA